jgi:hypothetical protein
MQRFHSTAAHASPHGLLNGVERLVDGNVQCRVSSSDNDAGEPTQDNLHNAFLIDAASRTVGVPCADRHPFDRPGELSQLHSQPSPDVRVVNLIEVDTGHAHVCGNRRGAAPSTLERPRHGGWPNSPPTRHELTDLIRQRFHRFTHKATIAPTKRNSGLRIVRGDVGPNVLRQPHPVQVPRPRSAHISPWKPTHGDHPKPYNLKRLSQSESPTGLEITVLRRNSRDRDLLYRRASAFVTTVRSSRTHGSREIVMSPLKPLVRHQSSSGRCRRRESQRSTSLPIARIRANA